VFALLLVAALVAGFSQDCGPRCSAGYSPEPPSVVVPGLRGAEPALSLGLLAPFLRADDPLVRDSLNRRVDALLREREGVGQ
jgi:hypothetical protein